MSGRAKMSMTVQCQSPCFLGQNVGPAYQECRIHRLFTQVEYELLQCHGLVVDGYKEVA
jgi:hypothetical protein